MPARLASGLPGTHIHPPDQAVAPPNTDSFSTTTTLSPCHAAVTAAARPEAPEPTGRRSKVIRLGLVAVMAVIIWPLDVASRSEAGSDNIRLHVNGFLHLRLPRL